MSGGSSISTHLRATLKIIALYALSDTGALHYPQILTACKPGQTISLPMTKLGRFPAIVVKRRTLEVEQLTFTESDPVSLPNIL